MSSKPTSTTAGPSRPDISQRAWSTDSKNEVITSSRTLSPTNTLSQSTTKTSSQSTKEHHGFPLPFSRSRSKSPRPPIDLSIPASTTLKHVQTSPLPGQSSSHYHPPTQRHKSDGALPSPSLSPAATSPSFSGPQKRDSWVQKKHRYSGSSPGGYGRHGDDWLFGGFSFRQTAKEIVNRGKGRRDEEKDSTGAQ